MNHLTAWAMLILSGLVDVAWAYATKRSEGFTNPFWSALSILLLIVFLSLLTKALQVLPLGPSYAVWTGIGAVGAMLVGIALLGETADPQRITFAAIILLGIIGLKLSS